MSTSAGRRALVVLFLVNVLNFYDRQTLGALAEPMRREFGLSDTQLGALTTFFTVVYAVAGLPLGRLADRWSRKWLLAIGVTVWASLTALGGLAGSYGSLLASRLGVGVGEAACAPAATSWIGDVVPATRRASALAVFMLAIPVGGMLSFAVSGPVAQAWGWRAALVAAAAPALLLVPALLALKEPARGASEPAGDRSAAGGPTSPRALLRIPTFWWIVVSGALVNSGLYVFSTFLPAFLTRVHGLSVAQAGVWAGIGSGVAGIAGGLGAGWLGDRIIRTRANGRMAAAALACLLAAPAAYAGIQFQGGNARAAIPALMVAYGLLSMYYGLVYSSIQDIVAPELRGTAMALYFTAMYLCGASFGPILTGRLSDLFARQAALAAGSAVVTEAARAAGLHQAMYVFPALSLAVAAALWAGSRTVEKDMARRATGERPGGR